MWRGDLIWGLSCRACRVQLHPALHPSALPKVSPLTCCLGRHFVITQQRLTEPLLVPGTVPDPENNELDKILRGTSRRWEGQREACKHVSRKLHRGQAPKEIKQGDMKQRDRR